MVLQRERERERERERDWVIYWKTESQEDWISIVQPRASIHQDPINNLTIES